MPLISIRRFASLDGDIDSAVRRVPDLLIETLALHAIDCDPAEREQFQLTLRKLGSDLQAARDDQSVLLTTGEIIRTLDDYSRFLERFWRQRRQQFHAMIRLLADKLIEITDAGDARRRGLQEFERSLERESSPEDLRLLQAQLEQALRCVPREDPQQSKKGAGLPRTPSVSHETESAAETVDPVTGLPDRAAALDLLDQINRGAAPHEFAALFCVDRLSSVNYRFGFSAGDNLLMLYAQHVAQHLAPSDQLFRWRGPSLLAILARSSSAGLAVEMRNISSARFEYSISSEGKTALIPVSGSCVTFEIRSYPNTAAVTEALDRFATERTLKP